VRFPILDALEAEATELAAFLSLLEAEQRALIDNTLSDLVEIAKQKTALAQGLEQRSRERQRLFEANGVRIDAAPPHTCLGADFLPESSWPALAEAWQRVLQLARHASAMNQTNGMLIETRQRQNQQLMTLLQGTGGELSYNATGQAQLTKRGGSLGKA
jgi:flagella synthesis protein FlgN